MSILDKDFEEQIAQKIEFNTIFPSYEQKVDKEWGPLTYKLYIENEVRLESHISYDTYESAQRGSSWISYEPNQREFSWDPVEFTIVDRQNQLFDIKTIYPSMVKRMEVIDRQRAIDEWGIDKAWVNMYEHYCTLRLTVKYPISSTLDAVLHGHQPQLSDPVDIEILIFHSHHYYRDVAVKLRIV